MTDTTARATYLARLQRLTEKLAATPDTPLPRSISGDDVDFWFTSGPDPRADLAACARSFRLGSWQKRTWEGSNRAYFEMAGEWDGWRICLNAYRDAVCTKVVTGTEVREVDEEVTPAVTRKVTKEVETFEWVCEPVTAPAELVSPDAAEEAQP